MAESGSPRTIVVPGEGTNSLSFVIPPNVVLDVESVLAGIDASGAAGDVTATLTVSEQAGVVIATKRQGEKVTAGTQGSATWALRLSDDAAGGGSVAVLEEIIGDGVGVLLAPNVSAALPWKHSFGAALLNLTTPTQPRIVTAGVYAFYVEARAISLDGAPYTHQGRFLMQPPALAFDTLEQMPSEVIPTQGGGLPFAITRSMPAGGKLQFGVIHTAGGNVRYALRAWIAKLS